MLNETTKDRLADAIGRAELGDNGLHKSASGDPPTAEKLSDAEAEAEQRAAFTPIGSQPGNGAERRAERSCEQDLVHAKGVEHQLGHTNGAEHLTEPSSMPESSSQSFFGQLRGVCCGLCCIGLAAATFGASLGSLLPADGPPSSSTLAPAAALAHCVSTLLLRFLERGFGITLHTRHCRQLTAAFVFGMAFVHVSAPAAVLLALLELTVCPTRLLWAPAPKRPSNTNAESKKKTTGKLKGIASNSAARYSSDAHGTLTCEFVGEISDRVRPLDDGCPVRTRAQVRFLWTWNGRTGGQESQEVVARADHVFDRASVPLPDEWFPTLRFAELPQIANKSADAALRGCRRPSEDDTSLSKAFLAAVHCECVGVARPFAEARCVSGYAAGMELWFDENGQRQMYMLVAELDGASCRSSSSCRIVLSKLPLREDISSMKAYRFYLFALG